MIEDMFLGEIQADNSSDLFKIQQVPITQVLVQPSADFEEIKISFPYFLTWVRPLEVNDRLFTILVIPQTTGNFVARTSTAKFNAIGQGKTEEEAMLDIKSAIETLMEEEANPSEDVEWPEDYR